MSYPVTPPLQQAVTRVRRRRRNDFCRPAGHPLSGENIYVRANGERRCAICRAVGIAKLNARRLPKPRALPAKTVGGKPQFRYLDHPAGVTPPSELIEVAGECWIWQGSVDPDGYGRASGELAHRMNYRIRRGPIPVGLHLDHLCRTPRCVNPDHLEPVTPAENNRRSSSITTANANKTQCNAGHPLSGDNLLIQAGGGRRCRACSRAAGLRAVAKRRAERVRTLSATAETNDNS